MISQVNPLVKSKVYLLVNISKLHKLQTQFLSKSPCPQLRGQKCTLPFHTLASVFPFCAQTSRGEGWGHPFPFVWSQFVPLCTQAGTKGAKGGEGHFRVCTQARGGHRLWVCMQPPVRLPLRTQRRGHHFPLPRLCVAPGGPSRADPLSRPV